jgi:hypothetical protein
MAGSQHQGCPADKWRARSCISTAWNIVRVLRAPLATAATCACMHAPFRLTLNHVAVTAMPSPEHSHESELEHEEVCHPCACRTRQQKLPLSIVRRLRVLVCT